MLVNDMSNLKNNNNIFCVSFTRHCMNDQMEYDTNLHKIYNITHSLYYSSPDTMLNQSASKATNSDKRPRGHCDHFVKSFGGMNCSLAIMSRTSAVW